MKEQLIKKIEETLKNEKIEYCCSNERFNKQIKELIDKFENLDSEDLTNYLNKRYIETNKSNEPYRTQISYTNFLMIEILKLYIEENTTTLSTEDLHSIETDTIEEDIKEHLENLKSLKINSSQLTASKLNKKIKDNIYTIYNDDKIEIQKDKKQKKRDQVFKAIKYLNAYGILQQRKIPNEKFNNYILNLENWFESQRYSLYKTPIISDLFVLLVAFLKYTAPNKVDHFLTHIDSIIDFLYTPSYDYETYSNIENHIIDKHILQQPITFETFDNELIEKLGDSLFEEVEIVNISIDTNSDKTLRFKKENNTYEIPINKIYRMKADKNERNSLYLETQKTYVIYNDTYKEVIKNKNYPIHKEHHNVILEADTNMLRFFETKPLKKQKIYKTKEEKADLFEAENLDIETTNSKIYITATDIEEQIFNVLQKGLPHIKILTPQNLNEKFKSNLTAYLDGI